jgi:hypothetical protein
MPRKGRPKNNPDDPGFIKVEYKPPQPHIIQKQKKDLNYERIEEALTEIYYIANNTDRVARGDKFYIEKLAASLVELI